MSEDLDPFVERIFLAELERQVRFSLVASGDLAQSVRGPRADEERFWYSIQGILIAAGNVSKIFWPSEDAYRARGSALRALLDVLEDSPLHPRAMRNHFEHFDDRIAKWAAEHAKDPVTYLDSNVGTLDGVLPGGLRPDQVLRHFDPSDFSVSFRGERLPLRPVQGALRDLGPRIEVAKTALGRAYARSRPRAQ